MSTLNLTVYDYNGDDLDITVVYESSEKFEAYFGDYKIRTLGYYKRKQIVEAINNLNK